MLQTFALYLHHTQPHPLYVKCFRSNYVQVHYEELIAAAVQFCWKRISYYLYFLYFLVSLKKYHSYRVQLNHSKVQCCYSAQFGFYVNLFLFVFCVSNFVRTKFFSFLYNLRLLFYVLNATFAYLLHYSYFQYWPVRRVVASVIKFIRYYSLLPLSLLKM